MSARNPHDRRGGTQFELRGDGMLVSGLGISELGMTRPRESPLAMEDIEALLESAVARSIRKWREGQERAEAERLIAAQRVAWDQGYAAGERDGRSQLLLTIDRQHGSAARDAIQTGQELRREMEGREVTPADAQALRAGHRKLLDLLDRLVASHHAEFAEDPPF